MTRVEVFAPAKINLALHITGRLDNGYHLLDSLVAFADIGDRVTLSSVGPLALAVTGPEATPELSGDDNIMWLAAARFWKPDRRFSMALEKHLPMASGIGGGSADAAAIYRGILYLRAAVESRDEPNMPTEDDPRKLMGIGADVPMCVLSDAARVRGIGERIDPIADFPALPVVLANPRVPVSTPAVFSNLSGVDNPGLDPFPARFDDLEALFAWLAEQRNDLQEAATRDCPSIATVLEALGSDERCRLARMSGTGATCFGLYASEIDAGAAAARLRLAYPQWWVRSGALNGGDLAEPQLIRSTT